MREHYDVPRDDAKTHIFWKSVAQKTNENNGVPYGIRTRVAAVKGRCPRPLDERDWRRGVDLREFQILHKREFDSF